MRPPITFSAIPKDARLFKRHYSLLKRAGRVLGEDPEGYAIERLHKMNLLDDYNVRVYTAGAVRMYRLADAFLLQPDQFMINRGVKGVSVGICYGAWRDAARYPTALRTWEGEVVEIASCALKRRPHDIVFAAIQLFGDIRASRGKVMTDREVDWRNDA